MEELAGMIGYNAMAVGNQDFNFGYRTLVSNMEDARRRNNFYVSANVKNGGRTITDRYKIFNFNGFKVGVIGLTTPETAFRTYPEFASGIKFDINVKELQRDINSIGRVVDYVVLLAHVGEYEEADKFYSIKTLLNQINGVDLVIDGHSHTEKMEAESANNALLVQAGSYLNNIGLVELEIESGEVFKTEYFLISGDDLEDPSSSETLKRYGITTQPYSEKVKGFIDAKKADIKQNFGIVGVYNPLDEVASIPQDFLGDRVLMQTQQTDLGFIIAESLSEACDADFSIINAGLIRSGLKFGSATADDIYAMVPYSYPAVRVSMTGKNVWEIFEYAASNLPSADSRYPQTDLHVEISPNLPIGSKVTAIYFRDGRTEVVNSSDVVYNVAINDYMLSGGDGFDIQKSGLRRVAPMKDIIMAHFIDSYPNTLY